MTELTHAQLLDIAKGVEPWATWLAPGGCLESAHLELAELMHDAIAADRRIRPQPTADDLETRFRAWWAESYPNAPAGPHAVRSHAAFALHLLGGEVAA